MTALQRKFVESRLCVIAVFVAVTLLQEHELLAQSVFGVGALYVLVNFQALREIEVSPPRFLDVLSANAMARFWLYAFIAAETVVAYYCLFTGRDLSRYVGGFGGLLLVFLMPVAPALYVHQKAQFLGLGRTS